MLRTKRILPHILAISLLAGGQQLAAQPRGLDYGEQIEILNSLVQRTDTDVSYLQSQIDAFNSERNWSKFFYIPLGFGTLAYTILSWNTLGLLDRVFLPAASAMFVGTGYYTLQLSRHQIPEFQKALDLSRSDLAERRLQLERLKALRNYSTHDADRGDFSPP